MALESVLKPANCPTARDFFANQGGLTLAYFSYGKDADASIHFYQLQILSQHYDYLQHFKQGISFSACARQETLSIHPIANQTQIVAYR